MSHQAKRDKQIKVGPYYYKFRIALTIYSLALLIILVYLGTWQLDRAAQKKTLLQQLQTKTNSLPVRLSTIEDLTLAKYRFTPVLVNGTYLNNYTFLLDNQVLHKQAGYRVLTVFQSPYLDRWLLIDRGWIARNKDRAKLPEIDDIYGVQNIQGIINTIPTGIILQNDIYKAQASWPIVVQNLDYAFITQNLHHPVYEFVVQIQEESNGAYSIPPIDFGVPSDKHFGYALQWFSFAALVIVYYLINSFKRK